MAAGDPYYPPCHPQPLYHIAPVEATLTLRDKMAVACLPAIYQQHTMLTDRAAELAYEQADEMLKARERNAALDQHKKEQS